MWWHVWRQVGVQGIFWHGGYQFSFYSKMNRTDFGGGKESSKTALEETKRKMESLCP